MNHIYFGLTLSFICLFLAYLSAYKFLLVSVFCVILAVLYFKDDFSLFRYLATHVASFYSWICDISLNIQTMYHQSNNTNFPIRRSIENNGAVSKKFDRLNQASSYNLSTSYAIDNKPLNSSIWDSGSTFSSPINSFNNRAHSSLQEMSKLSIGHQVRGKTPTSDKYLKSYSNSTSVSPMTVTHPSYTRTVDLMRSGSSSYPASEDRSSNVENKPVNAQLYADVSSPGFCGRIADRLNEESMTHQSKYDTVGAFPVVNLKSQSSRIKIKTPVRVRLAPPSNELLHYNYGANSLPRSPDAGPDDSMKSVLQVLKEISRKRIHSHVDEDDEESTKRSRVTESQFDSDGLLHTSLLQQTIQGKRVREESSPNEDDKKRRKASLKNNEIMSSLSSSISVRPPHLQSAKRKAQSIDDSLTSTPVLGKLLKVQTEVTPPTPTNHITAPDASASVPAKTVKEKKRSPSPAVLSPIVPPPAVVEAAVKPSVETPAAEEVEEEEGTVSRLLGRMSDQTSHTRPVDIPIKKNVFMSTNDLSLSPPKENRLAAMIAVLGGPSEQSELENTQPEAQPERIIKGKALFTTPETPATPESAKQKKNVTFSEALTTTKIFERDEIGNGSSVGNSLALPSTPLSSFSSSSNTTSSGVKIVTESPSAAKPFSLNFSSPLASNKDAAKPNENANFTVVANALSPGSQNTMFQTKSTLQSTTPSGSALGPSFSVPTQVSNISANGPSSGGFSFETNNSATNSSKDTSSPAAKPLSFSGETKTSQPDPGFPSLFSPVSSKSDVGKAEQPAVTAGQSKPMFKFGNRDASSPSSKNGNENKPIVNGFATNSTNSSPFATSQPIGQASTNKLPSFPSNANPPTTSQTPSPFSFGSSTAFSASSTIQQSTSTTQQSNLTNASAFQPNSLTIPATPSSMNIFSSTVSTNLSKPNPFASGIQGVSAFGDGALKSVSSNSQSSQANSLFGNAPSQSPGFGSPQALQNGAISSSSGTAGSNNLFGKVSSTTKPIAFGRENPTSNQSSVFGFSNTTPSTQASSPFGIGLNSLTSTTSAMFGNTTTSSTPTMFGNTATTNPPAMFGSTTTTNTPTMFGSTATTNTPTMFGNTTTTNPPAMFGSTTTTNAPIMFGSTTTTNAPTMFGSTTTTNTPTMFGNTTTAQAASVFGSATPSIGIQSSTFPSSTAAAPASLFGAGNDSSKNMFAGASSTAPTFGGLGNTSSPAFGNQSNPLSFGNQNTTAPPTFGNQSAPAFAFGSQNNTNTTQGGFGSGTFGANRSSTSTSDAKPPAFGSASPFMFSSSSTTKPTELVGPLGSTTQFAFNATQPNSPAQPSVQSFGTPTATFGPSLPTATFGASSTQPTASPAPSFQFGQASTPAAPAFQFNAAPPTVGGGMFSIGSGGSSTSRPKTTALRRSHKRT